MATGQGRQWRPVLRSHAEPERTRRSAAVQDHWRLRRNLSAAKQGGGSRRNHRFATNVRHHAATRCCIIPDHWRALAWAARRLAVRLDVPARSRPEIIVLVLFSRAPAAIAALLRHSALGFPFQFGISKAQTCTGLAIS